MRYLTLIPLFFSFISFAQSSKTLPKYDTLIIERNGPVSICEVNSFDGKLISKGKLVNGLKTGAWRTYNENKTLAQIEEFNNGIKEGFSVNFGKNGEILKEENFLNNMLNGEVKQFMFGGRIKLIVTL